MLWLCAAPSAGWTATKASPGGPASMAVTTAWIRRMVCGGREPSSGADAISERWPWTKA
jgi:hypothetical protein